MKIICLFFLAMSLLFNNFYDYVIEKMDGQPVKMSAFSGKKIMLVNVGSTSLQMRQWEELKTLSRLYMDKLVIIAVPSDSFDREPLTGDALRQFWLADTTHSVIVTNKVNVVGDNALGIYKWIANKQLNKRASFELGSNFQKILINEQGELIGLYGIDVWPSGQLIKDILEVE